MISHQAKKMTQEALRQFRDRFDIPMPDDKIAEMPFITLADGSPEKKYLHERRAALGGYLPQRRRKSTPLPAPPLANFDRLLQSSGDREISTTMAFVQMLGTMVAKDVGSGRRSCRRVAHVRHRHVSTARYPARAGSRRRMPTSSCTTARTSRAIAAGRHQRNGRDGSWTQPRRRVPPTTPMSRSSTYSMSAAARGSGVACRQLRARSS